MMKKIIVIVIVACLVASTTWLLFRKEPRAPISREEAIAKIRTYIVGVEKIPEENIRIDKIELRPPTESEENYLRESRQGKEPPELIWFADITRFFGNVGPRAGTIWLDADTGEIISGSLLD
jgi:ribosomal protein L20A (L18A)